MSESTEETRQQATVRVLKEAKPWARLPMRKYEDKELHIAVARKGSDGEFHLNLGENIWGAARATGCGLIYERLDNLIRDGWEID